MITLIYWRHRSTYDHKNDTFRAEFLIVPCFMLALVVNNRFDFLEVRSLTEILPVRHHSDSLLQIMWTFSIYLEAVAMLPQLYMIAKTGLPEPMVGHYLMALAMYRTLYIANWAYRYYFENFTDPIATISGCLQVTLLWSFLISFYAERKVHREEKLQIFIVDGRPTGRSKRRLGYPNLFRLLSFQDSISKASRNPWPTSCTPPMRTKRTP